MAARALGAAGVLIGTRFYAAEESLAAPAAKQRLVAGGGDATLRTRVFDIARRLPWPAEFTGRAFGNAFTERWHGREGELAAAIDMEQPRYTAAVEAAEFDTAAVWAGEVVDLVTEVAPTGVIMERLVRETAEVIQRLSRPTGPPTPRS